MRARYRTCVSHKLLQQRCRAAIKKRNEELYKLIFQLLYLFECCSISIRVYFRNILKKTWQIKSSITLEISFSKF